MFMFIMSQVLMLIAHDSRGSRLPTADTAAALCTLSHNADAHNPTRRWHHSARAPLQPELERERITIAGVVDQGRGES